MKISPRLLFTLGLVIFLIVYVSFATTYNYQARMMPLIIGVPILLLAALQLVLELRESAAKAKEPRGDEKPKEEIAPQGRSHLIKVYGWVLAMFVAIYLFGFVITTFVYPLLYLRFVGGRSWRLSTAISLGALAFLYIVMIYGLNVQLYDGMVVVALRKAIYGY